VFLAATRAGNLVLCEQATWKIERDLAGRAGARPPDPASPGPWVCPLTGKRFFSRRLRTAPLARALAAVGVALLRFGNSTDVGIMSNALRPRFTTTGSPGKIALPAAGMRIIPVDWFPWARKPSAKAGAEQNPSFTLRRLLGPALVSCDGA